MKFLDLMAEGQEIDVKYILTAQKHSTRSCTTYLCPNFSSMACEALPLTLVHKLPVEQISACCLGWCIF